MRSELPFASASARSAGAAQWRPGLAAPARHAEVFAPGGEAAGAGFALALARDHHRAVASGSTARQAWLWVQDKAALRLGGRPYCPGLPRDLRHRLIHVRAEKPEDALFAIEEGLRCRDLAFVIGEIAGNPRALDFTASRRLSLAVEKHGVPLWLVRLGAARDLGSARMRWEAVSSPSHRPRWDAQAPGSPSWRAELFRARGHVPGEWIVQDEQDRLSARRPSAPHPFDLVRGSGDRPLALG